MTNRACNFSPNEWIFKIPKDVTPGEACQQSLNIAMTPSFLQRSSMEMEDMAVFDEVLDDRL